MHLKSPPAVSGRVLALLVVAILATACGSNNKDDKSNPPAVTESPIARTPGTTQPTPSGPNGGTKASAKLKVSPSSLNLAAGTRTQTFVVANTGGETLTWSTTTSVPWMKLSPASGRLTAGKSQTVLVDVSNAPEGRQAVTIDIKSDGGQASIALATDIDYPPRIFNARFVNPSTGLNMNRLCEGNQVQIFASATDASGIASFRTSFSWIADATHTGGSGLTNMIRVSGSSYHSPTMFAQSDGDYTFRLIAADPAGHTRTGIAKVSMLPGTTCGALRPFAFS